MKFGGGGLVIGGDLGSLPIEAMKYREAQRGDLGNLKVAHKRKDARPSAHALYIPEGGLKLSRLSKGNTKGNPPNLLVLVKVRRTHEIRELNGDRGGGSRTTLGR